MKRFFQTILMLSLFTTMGTISTFASNPTVQFDILVNHSKNPVKGHIIIELYPDKAPISVQNFTHYVQSGFYDQLIFHRVIDGFMIQGGGFNKGLIQKPTQDPIVNESKNGLSNQRGTLSMARTSAINSATSQFFINVKDNPFLNHQNDTPRGYGYAVFGRVIDGMDLVDYIKQLKTTTKLGYNNVPIDDVIIVKAFIPKSNKSN